MCFYVFLITIAVSYDEIKYIYIITSLFLYLLLLGAALPLGALRVRVVCLWPNPALLLYVFIYEQHTLDGVHADSH